MLAFWWCTPVGPFALPPACRPVARRPAPQTTARRNDWALDKTVIITEVTKRQSDQIDAPSRDGAYVHGAAGRGGAAPVG